MCPIQSDNPPDVLTVDQWTGLNQQARRATIDDQELFWSENLWSIGPGNLRSCWGPGPPIYTAPAGKTILRIFFGYIGSPTPIFQEPPPGRLGWMFLSDGTVDQVDLDTQAVTHIGQIWEPISPYWYADAAVWRPRFFGATPGEVGGVLFGSPQGLYAWDNTALYSPGETAPDWLTNASSTSTTSTVMPSGLPGILALDVYQSRLFVAGETVISYSAPSNGADFSVTGGGGSFGFTGHDLSVMWRDLCQLGGYLYAYGDSSTYLFANVITLGDGVQVPVSTGFNFQNIDPSVGQGFPRKVGKFGRQMLLANGARVPVAGATPVQSANSGAGIWLMHGGEASIVSKKITNLWLTLDPTVFYPTFATVTFFGDRIMLCNGTFVDPWGQKRSMLLAWNGVQWSVLSQNLNLTHIGYYEQDSICDAYGTDGTSLYHLFDHPDPALPKRLSTKAMKGKQEGLLHLVINNWRRAFMELHDNSGQGVSWTGTMSTQGGGIPNGSEPVAFQLSPGKPYDILAQSLQGQGILGALDLESLSPDFTVERIHLMTESRTLFGA